MNETEAAKRTLIAERLKEARKLAGLSQGHVAKILGLHRPSVSEMEAGNRRVSADELARLAEIYDVSVAWLLGEAPETLDAQDPRLELAARELTKLKPDDLERLLKLLAAMRSDSTAERRGRRSMMNAMRTTKPSFNRRALATQAMQAAIATRAKAKLDQHGPICIYGLCETLGVTVRFNNINMEGMYQRGAPPRIHLSARRPLPRRAYNCAHELGHHVFGHGSSIDELREDAKEHPWEDPKEFLADTFAGFTLMPIMGLRRAFAVRGWTPETATAAQMFTIACDFGVGYAHAPDASVGRREYDLARPRAAALQRVTPRRCAPTSSAP